MWAPLFKLAGNPTPNEEGLRVKELFIFREDLVESFSPLLVLESLAVLYGRGRNFLSLVIAHREVSQFGIRE